MSEIIENFRKVFLANFANFEGRARRSEFWLFHLVLQLLCFILMIPLIFLMVFMISASVHSSDLSGILIGFYATLAIMGLILLAFVIPSLAVTARRLHDTNRSGWWMLLGFVPFGSIIVLYFLVLDGNENQNEYGLDPKEEERTYYRNLASQQSNISTSEGQQGYTQNY